ncbi:nickel-dependent hydrogenase large subunit [Elusimicrobiota bacterium]
MPKAKTKTAGRVKTVTIPANRVEGDLEIQADFTGRTVTDARTCGTMFRGLENIMVGRDAMDGLVLTSRICGLCSVSHLTAAVGALDAIAGAEVPDNARRVRNLCLMTEHVQSDIRQSFLMFAVDFANQAHARHSLYQEALRRYEPFKGETILEVIRETKRAVEIIAILGGQWPHSAFMVPGGVARNPSGGDVLQCGNLLAQYRSWYEKRILGCSCARWAEVRSASDLDAWLDESGTQRDGDLGFFIRFAREAGLDKIGGGHGNFLSFGSIDLPARSAIKAKDGRLIPAGFARGTKVSPFDKGLITEHVAYSWYKEYQGGKHPSEGETRPYATGAEGKKYSWTKAPRYDGLPAETGPLAEKIVGRDPLFTDLVRKHGPSAFVRQLARIVRPASLMPTMETWLRELAGDDQGYYTSPGSLEDGEGHGLIHAARGALGHWVKVSKGKIRHYQVITPTSWHASPRDSDGVRGPFEEALIGVEVRKTDNPVELGHVIRSFDPCMVCSVHALRGGRSRARIRL